MQGCRHLPTCKIHKSGFIQNHIHEWKQGARWGCASCTKWVLQGFKAFWTQMMNLKVWSSEVKEIRSHCIVDVALKAIPLQCSSAVCCRLLLVLTAVHRYHFSACSRGQPKKKKKNGDASSKQGTDWLKVWTKDHCKSSLLSKTFLKFKFSDNKKKTWSLIKMFSLVNFGLGSQRLSSKATACSEVQ